MYNVIHVKLKIPLHAYLLVRVTMIESPLYICTINLAGDNMIKEFTCALANPYGLYRYLHRQRNRGGGRQGGYWPSTFSRLTRLLLY